MVWWEILFMGALFWLKNLVDILSPTYHKWNIYFFNFFKFKITFYEWKYHEQFLFYWLQKFLMKEFGGRPCKLQAPLHSFPSLHSLPSPSSFPINALFFLLLLHLLQYFFSPPKLSFNFLLLLIILIFHSLNFSSLLQKILEEKSSFWLISG